MSIGGDLLMAHAEIAEKIVRESEMKKEIASLRARIAELEAHGEHCDYHEGYEEGWKYGSLDAAKKAATPELEAERKFPLGTRVRKIKGSSWQGKVVGFYSTSLTPIGYCVESEREPGSVQIYPESALEVVYE